MNIYNCFYKDSDSKDLNCVHLRMNFLAVSASEIFELCVFENEFSSTYICKTVIELVL